MGRRAVPAGRLGWATRALLGLALSCLAQLGLPSPVAAQTPYNSITLDWTAPGDDGNVGQVSSYELRYSTTAVGVDTVLWWNNVPTSQRVTLGLPLVPAGLTQSATVTGLTQGTTYSFVVVARDEVPNTSGFSNVAVGTTQSCGAPTSPPGQFSAVADTGQVLVSWNSTADPLAVSLNLYRAQGTTGPWSLLQNLPLATTSYVDVAVASGTTYRYRAAWMGSLCEGPSTSTETVTTPGTPVPPPPTGAEGSTIHAYPNPAGSSIRLAINVTASTPQPVSVRLFDMNGRWIATLANGSYPPGPSEISWSRVSRDGGRVAPGYYEILGTVGTVQVRERLVLLP